ncbi:MAG TPA: ATP-binding protein [Longimicrobiales bacterium]|nr:ATP-binding protein [Longimicrobiales bacterium]
MTRRLDAYPGVVLEVDDAGVIVSGNARLRELAGPSLEGRRFAELLEETSAARWQGALVAEGPLVSIELQVRTESGAVRLDCYVSAPDGGVRSIVELPSDPDVERLREASSASGAELAALTEELRDQEDAWNVLNTRLETQAAEVQRLRRSRERFYAAVSHELRTPLTAVLGYTNLLLDEIVGPMPDQQRSFVERTHRAALHLKLLIDDVLDLAKLESGTLELDLAQTTVRPLINELADSLGPLAAEHGSTLVLEIDDAPEFFTTDPRALRQVLFNLLTNALKFGASRPVRLRCTRSDDRVVFEVIDRGIGVPPGDIDRIFDDFVQLKPADHQGTGLGLSIARQLAERLGGRVEVESAPGAGSTFRLTLPMTGPAEA